MIFINDINPELFSYGPLTVRWYGMCFLIGIVLDYLILVYLFRKRGLALSYLDSLVIYLFFGLLIGARLGEILFYEPAYYLQNPSEILKIWHGGLASHGAAIGIFFSYLLWIRIHKISFSKFADILVIPMPLAAMFVRIGNFFNSEIIGTKTGTDYGVIFKKLGEDFPRHPAQLYEAFLSFIVFLVLFFTYKKYYKKVPELFFLFLYMLLYFLGRFFVEFFKDLHGPLPENFSLTMGQVLSSIPILISVGWFLYSFFIKSILQKSYSKNKK